MRRYLAALVVLCVWTGPAAAQGLEDLRAGLKLVQDGKFEQARERLSSALESQWLSRQQRGLAHLLRGLSNMALGDNEAARVDLDRAIALMEDDGTALDLRAALAWETGDKDQSYKDVLRLAREFPDDLMDVEISLIWRLWRWLKEEDRADDSFTLLEAVVKAGYRPGDLGVRPDGLVQEYIGGLLDRDQADRALPFFEKITSADTLIEMRVNGRYKALWDNPRFDAHTQPRPAAERDLAYWKTQAEKHAGKLSLVTQQIRLLRMLGKFDEAVQKAQTVLNNQESYENDKQNRLWLANELAYALQDTGRLGEADALLKPLLKRSVKEEPYLVSQLINYGTILMDMGENERALAAAEKARPQVSPFGRKWIEAVTACASHRLGRAADAEAALERLKIKPEENYSALSHALICLDRVDEAAQLALVRLRDPDHREAMLMNLQTYRERKAVSPLKREMKKRWAALSSRPEIVAEAEKHGRLLEIPLYPVYWGDL